MEEINKTLNLPIDTSAFEQGKVVLLSKTVEDLIQPGQEITIQTQNGQHSFIVANGYLNEGFPSFLLYTITNNNDLIQSLSVLFQCNYERCLFSHRDRLSEIPDVYKRQEYKKQ